jgi:putative tricarboxylic transport membrane protein
VFITRPISGGLLAVALLLLIIAALPNIRKRRERVFVE